MNKVKVKLFQHVPWRHIWRWGVPALILALALGGHEW